MACEIPCDPVASLVADSAVVPMSTAKAATANSQPSATGRIRRRANPVGLPTRARCAFAEPRSDNVAAPRSRVPARCSVTAVTAITKMSTKSNATALGPVSGRDSSIHPSGLNHTNQCRPGFVSATMRRAYATPKIDPGHGRGTPTGVGQLAGQSADSKEHGGTRHERDRKEEALAETEPDRRGSAGDDRPERRQYEQCQQSDSEAGYRLAR